MAIKRVTFQPVLSTSIYAANDVFFATIEVPGAVNNAKVGVVKAVTVHDADDEGAVFELYFLRSNVSFGTLNAAVSVSDANQLFITSKVPIASADYLDVGGAKVALVSGLNCPVEAAPGDTSIYVAARLTSGTPTFTAATDMVIDLWVEQACP